MEVTQADEVARAIAWAGEREVPWAVLGGGSNLVVADAGYPGLVIHLSLKGLRAAAEPDDNVLVTAAAGEEWDVLVEHCVRQGWTGIECLSGIPGRVGATPIQNVGAYGQETKDSLVSLRAYDSKSGTWQSFERDQCKFRYRDSRFKSEEAGRYVVVEVTYRLRANAPPTIRYPDLQRALPTTNPTLQEVRDTVLAVRRKKSMVIDPQDPNSRSVGSFFVNPIVSEQQTQALGDVPHYPAGEGHVKLSAAWLIEHAGLHRGFRMGNVGLSENHTLAIVNRGGGTAREVTALMQHVQATVNQRFGVWLTPEPVFLTPAGI